MILRTPLHLTPMKALRRTPALSLLLSWLALASPRVAAAGTILDPDTEIALRHFDDGRRRLDAGAAEGALAELEAARRLRAMPVFDYYIALTLERLGRWAPAADAYKRYLAGRPEAHDAAQVKQRIADLEAGRYPTLPRPAPAPDVVAVALPPAASTPAPALLPPVVTSSRPTALPTEDAPVVPAEPRPRRLAAPVAMAVVAVVLVATGAGLVGSVASDYQALHDQCARSGCEMSRIDALETRARVGYAFLGLAGAAAVIDVVLWGVMARKPAPSKSLAVAPTLGGFQVTGTF